MKITTLVILIMLAFSNTCIAKEKVIKDPIGTVCKSSDLTEIISLSAPKSYAQLPSSWKIYPNYAHNRNSNFVAFKVRMKKDGVKEEPLNMEKELSGDSYFVSNFYYMKLIEAKKLNLKNGDKKYCLGSFANEGSDGY